MNEEANERRAHAVPAARAATEPTEPTPWAETSSGWVVRVDDLTVTGRAANRPPTWWCGADHGFGTTSGPLTMASVWPTKTAAEAALRTVYGSPAQWKRRGYLAVPIRLGRPDLRYGR